MTDVSVVTNVDIQPSTSMDGHGFSNWDIPVMLAF